MSILFILNRLLLPSGIASFEGHSYWPLRHIHYWLGHRLNNTRHAGQPLIAIGHAMSLDTLLKAA